MAVLNAVLCSRCQAINAQQPRAARICVHCCKAVLAVCVHLARTRACRVAARSGGRLTTACFDCNCADDSGLRRHLCCLCCLSVSAVLCCAARVWAAVSMDYCCACCWCLSVLSSHHSGQLLQHALACFVAVRCAAMDCTACITYVRSDVFRAQPHMQG